MNLRQLKAKWRNEAGGALVYVLLVGGVISMIAVATSDQLNRLRTNVDTAKLKLARDQLGETLAKHMRNPDVLRTSARTIAYIGNARLNRCVFGGGCTGGVWQPFNLLQNLSPTDIHRLAGTLLQPETGGLAGNFECAPGPSCPFITSAEFKANCLAGAACFQAQTINVRTLVRYNRTDPAVLRPGRPEGLGDYPRADQYALSSNWSELLVADISNSWDCPAGSSAVGFRNTNGGKTNNEVECRCNFETVVPIATSIYLNQMRSRLTYDSRGRPNNCNAAYNSLNLTTVLDTCIGRGILTGLRLDAGVPKSQCTPNNTAYRCYSLSPSGGSCANGGKIYSVSVRNCRFINDPTIVCNNAPPQCCSRTP